MAAPMCRSRTDDFFAKRRRVRQTGIRRAPSRNYEDKNPLMTMEEGQAGMGREYVMPEWVDALDEIRENENSIRTSLLELAELQRKKLLPKSLFTLKDNDNTDIQLLSAQISVQFKKADKNIRRLPSLLSGAEGGEHKKIITNVQLSLTTQLSDLSKEFREMQRNFLRAEKERSGKPLFKQSEEIERWEREEQQHLQEENMRQQNLTVDQMEMMRLTDEMVSQRDAELQDIVKNLLEVQEMFTDLNSMVIDQGTMLDRIDENVGHARESVRKGVGELKKAEDHAKNTRFKLTIALLLLLIIIFSIALIMHK
ncbi:Syntaxin-43 [Diplonema papillatum]|nr:Syntaxin-43 [Diplonema papillatum]